ncbi:MAG: hypothetical protein M3O46_15940 [Myxococcota bacterium]|nr:hypothetical protein [Myxococcota bacterium]
MQFAAPPLELPELLLEQPASPEAEHIPPLLVPLPPLEHATTASQMPGMHPIAICFHLSISTSSS